MADKPADYEVQQSPEEVHAWVATPDLYSPAEHRVTNASSEKAKSSEEVLLELLLAIEGDKISLDAFQFLFELLEEYTREYHLLTTKKLKDLFHLLFQLLLASDELQLKVAKSLNALIRDQPSIRQFCKDTEWLQHLLTYLPNFEEPAVLDELLIMVETLAQHHISAKQVSMIFRLLQSDKPKFKAYCWTHIFQLLQRLWHGRDGSPNDYFEFDGNVSGILLPAFKFPQNGYSLCTWVSVDGFASPFVKDTYMPYLFSFMSEEFLGMEAFFMNNMLTFRSVTTTKSDSKRNQPKTASFPFRPRHWYFICITHTSNFIRSDEMNFYVDGQLIQTLPVYYPKMEKSMVKHCRLGLSSSQHSGPKFALRGQMSGFGFFEEILSAEEIKMLYSAGPGLFSSLRQIQDVLSRPASLFSQKRAKLLFMYSPRATSGQYCLEPLSKMPDRRAVMLDGTRNVITSGIQESLFSIGGIQLLLPLFSNKYRPQLSEPIDINTRVISLISELVRGNPYYQSQLLASRFFELMGHLLSVPQFAKTNLWSSQAITALEELSRAIYNFDIASPQVSVTQAQVSVTPPGGATPSVNPNNPQPVIQTTPPVQRHINEPLFRQFFKSIFLNFKIWVNTDFAVQKLLMQSIWNHVKKNTEYFHINLLTVEVIMTALADHFSYKTDPKELGPGDVDWSTKQRNNLLEIRWILLEILRAVVAKGITLAETTCIVQYLEEENTKPEDRRLVVDVLQLVLTFFNDQSHLLIPHLHKIGGIKLFIPLLNTDNEKFRVWTLKLIGKLFHATTNIPAPPSPSSAAAALATPSKKEEVVSPSVSPAPTPPTSPGPTAPSSLAPPSTPGGQTSSSSSSSSSNALAPSESSDTLVLVKKALEPFGLSYNIYICLTEILVGNISIEGLEHPLQNAAAASPQSKRPVTFRYVTVLPVIFELLISSDFELKERVLRDLIALLQSSSDSRIRFLEQRLWQSWLFGVLAVNKRRQDWEKQVIASHGEGASFSAYLPSPAEVKLEAAVSDLVTLLLEHSLFQTAAGSMKAFDNTTASLAYYRTAFPSLDASSVAESITRKICRTLVDSNDLLARCRQSPVVWQNTVHLLFFIEEFLFDLPPIEDGKPIPLLPLTVVHDARGVWRAFGVAQKVLDFLDAFMQIRFLNPFDMDEKARTIMEKMEERVRRFQLRLVLYSINEAGALKSSQKVKLRKDSFVNIKHIVENTFKDTQAIQTSLARYLRKKTQQWDIQMSDVDLMSQKNLKRVKDISIVSQNFNLAIYLLSFIHSIRKMPDTSRDETFDHLVGALFEVMVVSIRTRLLENPQYAAAVQKLHNENLIGFFMSGLDHMADFPLKDLVMGAIETVTREEVQSVGSSKDAVRRRQARVSDVLKQQRKVESDRYANLYEEAMSVSVMLFQQSVHLRNKLRMSLAQYSAFLASEWKSLLRLLTDSRGPWASPHSDENEDVYWKLDMAENRKRMRLRLKRYYGDVSMIEKASQLNDAKRGSAQTPEEPSSPKPSKQAVSKAALLANLPKGADEDTSSVEEDWHELKPPPSMDSSLSDPTANAAQQGPRKARLEKTLHLTTSEFIRGIVPIDGEFEITNACIYFRNMDKKLFKTIPLEDVVRVYSRRYMLRTTAIELFTRNHISYFFNFSSAAQGTQVLKTIVSLRPPNLQADGWFAGHPSRMMKAKKNLTDAWRKREISNFEYLMELNSIAGRTYNDPGQYPVFPWVISDYTSKKIDLNDPKVYRDLSKPVGALEPKRLQQFLDRWENFVDPSIPKFLYGSHYSSIGIVLFYLCRLEPFTSQFVSLQGGAFDHPARMFWSIPVTWQNCMVNSSDVKELIPEFFYSPEFLANSNGLNLGRLPDGTEIGDVQLPPWADSPEAFIEINRAALESEYVSAHLHEWIDLIFGSKQTGDAAIEANNVFYYLTYEGAVDIDQIDDPVVRQSVLSQIKEFGQTPCQLFKTPHPARYTQAELQALNQSVLGALLSPLGGTGASAEVPAPAFLGKVQQVRTRSSGSDSRDIVHVQMKDQDKLIIVFKDGLVFPLQFKPPSRSRKFPISFSQSPEYDIISSPQRLKEHDLELLISSSIPPTQLSQCVASVSDCKYLFHCGNWDNTIVCSNVSDVSDYIAALEHHDVVTCLALSEDSRILATASRDCNCYLWDVDSFSRAMRREKNASVPRPYRTLCGHDDVINSIVISADLDIVATGSSDKTVIVSSLRKGRYLRTIQHESSVTLVHLAASGDIITYCQDGEILSIWSINGKLLKRIYGVGVVSSMTLSADGKLLVLATMDGNVSLRSLHLYSLRRVWKWKCPSPPTALRLIMDDQYLIIGLQDGAILATIFDMNDLFSDMCSN